LRHAPAETGDTMVSLDTMVQQMIGPIDGLLRVEPSAGDRWQVHNRHREPGGWIRITIR